MRACTRLYVLSVAFLVMGLPAVAGPGDPASLLTLVPIRLQASNPVHNGREVDFGASIDLDQGVLVVGAPREDMSPPGVGNDAGAVYIFERQGTGWVEVQKLRAPVETDEERFGASVAVALGDDGIDFLIVGAPVNERAYMFHRINNGDWEHETTLIADFHSSSTEFGTSVAIDYHVPADSPTDAPIFVAVVGAPENESPPIVPLTAGSVTVFQRSGDPSIWGFTHEFYGNESSDYYGRSVAIAQPGIVASLEGLDEVAFNGGGARILPQGEFNGETFGYSEETYLVSSAPVINGQMGQVITVEHHQPTNDFTAVIGDPADDTGEFNAGLVFVFGHSCGVGTTCVEDTTIQPPGLVQSSNFGASVALSSTFLAAGAPGFGRDGTVFLYERGVDASVWNMVGDLTVPPADPVFYCRGGTALALQGLTLAVGCPAPSLAEHESVWVYDGDILFVDGFESGDTTAW